MIKILIIGFGFVGKATYILNNIDVQTFIYDINPELCQPKNINLQEITKIVDIVFISLPTPLDIDGTCMTNLIDNILLEINHEFIIIRSTIPIGYCDSKNVFFMPEFLTEKNWKEDFINNKKWIFGINENCSEEKKNLYKKNINFLINSAHKNKCINYNEIIFCSNKEAELLKLIKNTFLSTKVSYFNEIYDLTQKLNIDYNNVIELVKTDERIGNSHMLCPGYDNKRGYGGTCFPKDTNSMYCQLIQNDINTQLFEANLYRNEIIDRPDREWLNDIGRTNMKNNEFKIILVIGDPVFDSESFSMKLCFKLIENPKNKIIYITKNNSNFEKQDTNIESNLNFKILKFDITKKIFLPHIDEIYHIISTKTLNNLTPIEVINNNFIGTKNLLELAKYHNSKLSFYYESVNIKEDIRLAYNDSIKLIHTMIIEHKKIHNLDINILNIKY